MKKKKKNNKIELKHINFLVSPNEIKLSEFEGIIRDWLLELKKELKEIENFTEGKSIEGIDDSGYCTGILNYGQPIKDYREQLRGAMYFINIFFNMK